MRLWFGLPPVIAYGCRGSLLPDILTCTFVSMLARTACISWIVYAKAGEETLNLDTFGTLGRALGVFGLGGIDRLLGLRAAEVCPVRCDACY